VKSYARNCVRFTSDIQRVILETRPGSLWHRFFAWLLRKAAAIRQEYAEDRREIEDEMRGG